MPRLAKEEYFIHEELLRRAEAGLKSIPISWKKKRRVDPFMLLWPVGPVACDDGGTVDGMFLLELPEDKELWNREIEMAVERTEPYALLMVEQKTNFVLAVFESIHGTRSWRFPLKPHGGVRILGKKPVVKNDEDGLGILR